MSLLIINGGGGRRSGSASNPTGNVAQLIFLTGQSNAVGVSIAFSDGPGLPAGWYDPQADIQMWWDGAFEDMDVPLNTVDPVHVNGGDTYWGVEQTWSHDLQAHVDDTVFIYKLAIGGLGIAAWQSGGTMYTRMHNDLPLVIADLLSRGYDSVNCVVGWLQGEANKDGPSNYQEILESVVDDIRGIDPELSNAAFIMMGMHPDYSYFAPGQAEGLNAAYEGVKASRTRCEVLYRETIGTATEAALGNVHDDDPSKMAMGHAFFDAQLAHGWI